MRITLVTETFAPQVNGVSRTLGQLVRVLRASGDVVQVIHPDYGEPSTDAHAVAVPSVPLPFYSELLLPIPPFGHACNAIDEFGPELVHVATEATLGHAALRHALDRKIPIVSSFHTNFDQYAGHYGMGWVKGPIWRYLRWFHNSTRETYAPSRATIADLAAKGLERLVLWPRGVDGTAFRPDRARRDSLRSELGFAPDAVVVGHVSRIAAEKNVGYLGEALAILESQRPLARVLIVGDGPARGELESKLGANARFAGYRTGDDLADHYAACDLFAFASLTETFGNVVLEAMASGLPVVAVNSGGPGEIIQPGLTGVLIQPDAPPSTFADALIRLVDDAEERSEIAASARAYALTQTWDAIMGALRKRYLRIVSDANPSPSR